MAKVVRRKATEVVEDFGWLIEQGVHPLLAASQMGMKIVTIEAACRRAGARELSNLCSNAISEERHRLRNRQLVAA